MDGGEALLPNYDCVILAAIAKGMFGVLDIQLLNASSLLSTTQNAWSIATGEMFYRQHGYGARYICAGRLGAVPLVKNEQVDTGFASSDQWNPFIGSSFPRFRDEGDAKTWVLPSDRDTATFDLPRCGIGAAFHLDWAILSGVLSL